MGQPFQLQEQYTGMCQDAARDSLPSGMLWNCVDYIPQYLGAGLTKRGGWTYTSTALGANTLVNAIIYAPFTGGSLNIAVGGNGHVYKFTSGANTDVGTATPTLGLTFHRSGATGLVVIPDSSAAAPPKSYDGTTFGTLGGTPPQGIFADVWNDRLLLANGIVSATAYPNRVWFGPVGNDAGTWDTTNAWIDGSRQLYGIAALKNVILLYGKRATERLVGTIPPSATTVGDLTLTPAFEVGCLDPRSIAHYNDTVIWADARGVYQSDGAALKTLTAQGGGMTQYWKTMVATFDPASDVLAGGIYNDTYIVTLTHNGAFVDCLAFDLIRGFWFRMANLPGMCFARVGDAAPETYMGHGTSGRVVALSSILSPSATTKNDGDGAAVQPYYETGLYRGFARLHRRWVPSMAIQNWDVLYSNYKLTDAASDSPVLTVSYATDFDATSYTAISRTLAANTKMTRVKRDLKVKGNGLMLKVAQTNASAVTQILATEAEYTPLESSRLVQ